MNLLGFYKEVKAEMLRVTWPSRNEVLMAVGLVFFLALIAGGFFLAVDAILFRLVQFILGV